MTLPLLASFGAVRIRPKSREDALEDYAWRRDPEVTRLDGSGPLTLAFSEFLEWFEREQLQAWPDRAAFALEDGRGMHFGNIAFYNVDAGYSSAEIGISVGLANFRSRGFGTDAMVAFVRYLWDTKAFRLLFLHTYEWNEPAIRSFRRAGFSEVARVVRQDGIFLRMEARREYWLQWDQAGRFVPRSVNPDP